jgi:diguanylate cyclase (GGDEF)-like protein
MVACSIPAEESEKVFERFRKAVAETPFLEDDLGLDITVSIGIRQYSGEPGSTKSNLLNIISDADAALYRAKNGGRNRIEITDHVESKYAERHTEYESSESD